jgi:hypothetical protein
MAKVIVYKLSEVSAFLLSVAKATATIQHTRVRWEEYRDSTVLNVIYAIMPWKGHPGMAVVDQEFNAIQQSIHDNHRRYLSTWLDKTALEGAPGGNRYLQGMQNVKTMAEQDLQNTLHNVSDINNDVLNETNQGIRNLAHIKLASAVTLAVLTVGPALGSHVAFFAVTNTGKLVIGGMGVANGITHSMIKNWDNDVDMSLTVAIDNSMPVSEAATGAALDMYDAQSKQIAAQSRHLMSSTQGIIDRYSRRAVDEALKESARRNATATVARETGRLAAHTQAASRAATAAKLAEGAGTTLSVLFAGRDIANALDDYNETVRATH